MKSDLTKNSITVGDYAASESCITPSSTNSRASGLRQYSPPGFWDRSNRRIFVIGATGAQGLPLCRGLAKDGGYSLRILTRDSKSARVKELSRLGDVEVIEGSFAKEADLRKGFDGCWGAFVNIDGFNCGEKTETYWTIRAYELAVETGIKFFVFGNLDYVYKKSGYNPKLRTGHYDGKGRLAEWMLQQRKDNDMGVAIFTTGPYMEMTIAAKTLMKSSVQDGVVTWHVPLGNGAVPLVALEDCEYYVRWLFDHPERSDGLDLQVAIDPITFTDIASAFQKVTGQPAQSIDVSEDVYFANMPLPDGAPAGYNADSKDPATMSFKDNFRGSWTMWKHSGGSKGVIQLDYRLLDEIHPNRIRTAEEFFRRSDAASHAAGLGGLLQPILDGKTRDVLKMTEDNRKGKL